MKVGLFFGTFDPLHIGHDQIASYFLKNFFDQIWFVVTPHNPHKEKLVLTDEKIRLEMVKKFSSVFMFQHIDKINYYYSAHIS